jgi:hypothetical protein
MFTKNKIINFKMADLISDSVQVQKKGAVFIFSQFVTVSVFAAVFVSFFGFLLVGGPSSVWVVLLRFWVV